MSIEPYIWFIDKSKISFVLDNLSFCETGETLF